jgi:SAM-dependent methyltransferase
MPDGTGSRVSEIRVKLMDSQGHHDFAVFRDRYAENMERMFAAVSDLYARYWHDFFHFAIFENDDESWDEAFARTHHGYLKALRAEQARKVLELACGRGGFANLLAENTSGTVLGIDISRAQLSHARRFRRANLEFRHHDIMRVHELGELFDAVSLLDADCYLPDKGLAIRRISEVMPRGARFLLVAWCKREGLGGVQEELVLHPFMRYWGVPSLETPTGYRRHFRAARLELIEEIDLNDKVRRNWEHGYKQALEGIRTLSLADLPGFLWKGLTLGSDGIRLLKEQFPAALHIKAAFEAGFLRYVYFLGERM